MNQINWEVRDDWNQVAGWFTYDFDAEKFVLAQTKPEQYTVVRVNKTAKENDLWTL